MIKLSRLILIAALGLSAAGCFDYGERIELNADGSGILTQHMVLYKGGLDGLMQMMQAFSQDSTDDSSMSSFINRAEVEKKLVSSKSDVKLLDFSETQTDSTMVYDIKYSFKDLASMMQVTEDMNQTEMLESAVPKKDASFAKGADGNWIFTREFGDSAMSNIMGLQSDSLTKEISPNNEADTAIVENPFDQMGKMMEMMMKQAFADRTLKLTVKFPGTIVESNATKIDGNEATWEYKLIDAAKAPNFLRAVVKP